MATKYATAIVPLHDARKVVNRVEDVRAIVGDVRVVRFGNGSVEARFALTPAVQRKLWAAGYLPCYPYVNGMVVFMHHDNPPEVIFTVKEKKIKVVPMASATGASAFSQGVRRAPKGTPATYRKPRLFRP